MSGDQNQNGDLNGVLKAVNALFAQDTPQKIRAEANQWLTNFRKQRRAWGVANKILSTPNLGIKAWYFAASTLADKIQFDFNELPKEQQLALRGELFKHASNHAGNREAASVHKQLAIAISRLAIYLVGSAWPKALENIVAAFDKTKTAFVLLYILTYLPEECDNYKLALKHAVKSQAGKIFARNTEHVVKLLHNYMRKAGNDVNLQEMVYRCYLSWVRYGDISPQALVNDYLFKRTFDALKVEGLFEISVEVMTELVVHTTDVKKYAPAVKVLLPHIFSLKGKYEQACREEDSENCKALTRLFVETGEKYMDIVLLGGNEAGIIIKTLLRCTQHPDKNLAYMTFNFWYNLSREVNEEEHKQVRQKFHEPFLALIPILKGVMQYPRSISQMNDNKEIGEYKQFRYCAADVLVDAIGVEGIQRVLQTLLKFIKSEWENYQKEKSRWHGVNACLCCFRSVARRVRPGENDVLPQIMRFLPNENPA
mmetsp:Transcript_32918/g.80050  ORF Transcript_32918/g.80050 Transcript_32918/m.80050 type:complete len:483 (-) Transcript_32918:28-1476(-)